MACKSNNFNTDNMASWCALKCSSTVCLVLCLYLIYLIFNDINSRYVWNTWNKTLSKEKVVFSVSLTVASPRGFDKPKTRRVCLNPSARL